MAELMYLPSGLTIDQVVDSILSDSELQNCNLTKDKVLQTVKSFAGDRLASIVFLKKYALRNESNEILEFTLAQAAARWAKVIAIEDGAHHPTYFEELYNYFLPGGRQMLALGNPYLGKATVNNCYTHVIPEDSLEGIFEAAYTIAKTFSYGGGQGLDIGVLRPAGAEVSNTAKTSTGSVSFMKLYSAVTGIIGQYGRRGALMISCPVNHPDIVDFVKSKQDTKDIEFANISVKIFDDFMRAVEADSDYTLSFQTKHELVEKTIKAKKLWEDICTTAYKTGDPGLLFWDRIREWSPSGIYQDLEIVGVNPCAELGLSNNEACCLGSLLLHKFVDNPFTPEARIDWKLFEEMVERAVRHLDAVVSIGAPHHPLKEQQEKTLLGRRIGLGITGLADMLLAMNLKYDNPEAIELTEQLMCCKRETEYQASMDLAMDKGPFPVCRSEEHYEQKFTKQLSLTLRSKGRLVGQRNVSISTVAPSGSISIISHCSGGIEPHYDLSYTRAVLLGNKRVEFNVVEPGVTRLLQATGIKNPEDYVVPAHKVDWKQRIQMQATIQKYVDSSISSTINLPKGTKPGLIGEIYGEAWKQGLKGITVYVDGSKKAILENRKHQVDGDTICYKFKAEGGDKFYIHISYVGRDKSKPYQIFATNYKATEKDKFIKLTNELRKLLTEKGVAKSILKHGETTEQKIEQQVDRSKNTLDKLMRFLSLVFKSGYLDDALSILDTHAFAGSLAWRLKKILSYKETEQVCPQCGGNLIAKEGCFGCLDCGYEKCGG